MSALSASLPSACPPLSEVFGPATAPRRVLVYAPLAYSTPHFETDLEIAQRHIDLGDHVELILCDGELPSCQLNPHHDLRRCVQCVSRNLQGSAQLSAATPVLSLLTHLTPDDQRRLASIPRNFADQAALRKYHYEDFDAGMAVLSSLIDFARSMNIDTRQHSDLVHRTLLAAISTYLALKRILSANRYDRVYIYNGRWSMVRSVVRACETVSVAYYTHERGSDFRKFALYHNALPHDMNHFQVQTKAAWKTVPKCPENIALAESFFRDRRQRVEKTWFSFTKQQEAGRVPADWGRTARRIVFFTSSEFECAAIGDTMVGRIYPDQVIGAQRIARHLAKSIPEAHLWIRVHPNDNGEHTVKRWIDATSTHPNVTLVAPDEQIDSYALLDGSDRILTFGSTMGVEATFWGKPSVCADYSFYDGLGAQYDALNEDQLIELLTCARLEPKPREHALQYGYYLSTVGETFRHFVTNEISDYGFKSPFRGHCLKPDYNDLRQRLYALYASGDFLRASTIASLCAGFSPEDDFAHSIRILSALRLKALPLAITALEEASRASTPQRLEKILSSTTKGLLDGLMDFAKHAPATEFRSIANRAGQIMLQAPAFVAMASNIIALSNRAVGPRIGERQPVL